MQLSLIDCSSSYQSHDSKLQTQFHPAEEVLQAVLCYRRSCRPSNVRTVTVGVICVEAWVRRPNRRVWVALAPVLCPVEVVFLLKGRVPVSSCRGMTPTMTCQTPGSYSVTCCRAAEGQSEAAVKACRAAIQLERRVILIDQSLVYQGPVTQCPLLRLLDVPTGEM